MVAAGHLYVLQGRLSSAVNFMLFEFHAAAAAFAVPQPTLLSVCLLDRRTVTYSVFSVKLSILDKETINGLSFTSDMQVI